MCPSTMIGTRPSMVPIGLRQISIIITSKNYVMLQFVESFEFSRLIHILGTARSVRLGP